uniref:Uncharacterized protein n=1 Tax=Oryza glaberrima TaxID=4538 RepID=I1Q1F0_ORYGL
MSGEWSVKLFDCFGDSGTCCLTCWCPCITFGRIAEIVDRGSTCRHINLSLRALVQAQKTINLVC